MDRDRDGDKDRAPASDSADPPLAQGDEDEVAPHTGRPDEPHSEDDKADEASQDSFPTSDAPSW
ncbi:MAG: hypothetical protein ABR529_14600 [Actinomycetota bacterium]